MTTKILNQAQAEAVYSAMCHLNNVRGFIKVTLPIHELPVAMSGTFIRVWEDDGHIKVRRSVNHDFTAEEFYDDQSAFATAYGLQQG